MRFLHTWSRPNVFSFLSPSLIAVNWRMTNVITMHMWLDVCDIYPLKTTSTTDLGALELAARAYWFSCLIGVALPARVHERPRFGRSTSQSKRMQDKHTIIKVEMCGEYLTPTAVPTSMARISLVPLPLKRGNTQSTVRTYPLTHVMRVACFHILSSNTSPVVTIL